MHMQWFTLDRRLSGRGWNGFRNSVGAMHRNVETLIGRLATDPMLCRRFAEGPAALLGELCEQGLELTPVEIAALAATDPQAIRRFAEALDPRLRKAPLPAEADPEAGAGPPETTDPEEMDR